LSTSCSAAPAAKGRPRQLGRPAHCVQRRSHAHALHVEAGAQAVEEQLGVGVQAGYVVLAQAQHHPQVGVIQQRLVELAEEALALPPAPRMRRDDLLELVDDQGKARAAGCGRRHVAGRTRHGDLGLVDPARGALPRGVDGRLARQPGQEVAQRHLGQPLAWFAALVQAGHQVEGVDVVHLGHAGRQLARDAAHRQRLEALLVAQPGNDTRVEQRTLARARLGIEQQQPLRHDARRQVARLALAAEEEALFFLGEGAGADVGVGRLGNW
jgi:hypothetical protein